MHIVESSVRHFVKHVHLLKTIFLKLLTCILTHMHFGRGRTSLVGTFVGAFSEGESPLLD